MAAKPSKTAKPSPDSAARELVIVRVFDAPRELVFAAWTQGEHLARWSAPEGMTLSFGECDVRPGGAYRCTMRAPDGAEHRLRGVYREVVPPERLVFTHVWEGADGQPLDPTVVTVRFTAEGDKTRMHFHQAVFESVESRDGHAEGWESCFRLLDAYLQELPGGASKGAAR